MLRTAQLFCSLSPWGRRPGLRPSRDGHWAPGFQFSQTMTGGEPPAGGPSSQHHINVTLLTKAGGGAGEAVCRETPDSTSTPPTSAHTPEHRTCRNATHTRTHGRLPTGLLLDGTLALTAKPRLSLPRLRSPRGFAPHVHQLLLRHVGHLSQAVGSRIRLAL